MAALSFMCWRVAQEQQRLDVVEEEEEEEEGREGEPRDEHSKCILLSMAE